MKPNSFDQITWLKVVIALVSSALLVVGYLILPAPQTPPSGCVELVRNAIPSGLVVLLSFISLYYLFIRNGIRHNSELLDPKTLAASIASYLREGSSVDLGLVAFHQTLRDVNWKTLLTEAKDSLDLVVYYYDSWVNLNDEHLRAFFQKPKTKLRILLADPEKGLVLDEVHRLFPEYSKQGLREKIVRTGERLRSIANAAGAASDRVEIWYVPHPLSYSAQIIDERLLVLSFFEMHRQQKIDSPAFIIDISQNKHLRDYIEKEFTGLLKKSRNV